MKKMKIKIDSLIYELDNDEATVVGNTIDKVNDLNIPRKIIYENKEYAVTEIAPQVFKGNRYIGWVSIPSTVKKVGAECFASSSIKELYFEQIVALYEVEICESLCHDSIRLEYVHLASGIISIPEKSFYNCISLKEINTPWRLTSINRLAFYNCYNMKHFDFTELITSIGASAFYGSNLNYAEIGSNVKTVEDLVFASIENLKTLVVASQNYEMGNQIISDNHRVVVYLKGTEHSQSVISFKGKMSKDHYYIIDDFNLIEQNGIRYIKFSKNLVRILSYNETNIESHVTIPEQIDGAPVTDFQPGAFKYSNKLESVVFPKSILRNKGKVFEGASNLKKVVFQHQLTLDEARWIVSNDNVEIEIANLKLKERKTNMKERPNALDFMYVCKLLYPFEKQLIEIKKAKDRDELLEVVYSKQPHEVIGFDRSSEVFIKHDITDLSKKIFNIVKSLKQYKYDNKTIREINGLRATGSSNTFSEWTLEQVYIHLQTMYDNVIWGIDLVDELYVEYTVIQGDILDILNCFLVRT